MQGKHALMKIKLTSGLVVNIIITAFIVFVLAGFLLLHAHSQTSTADRSDDQTVTIYNNPKPIDEVIPDSLPYSRYRRLKDSVTTLRKLRNGDMFNASSNSGFGLFATYSSNYCNNCNLKSHKGAVPAFYDSDLPVQYYLKLSGWKLKQTFFPDSVRFYVNNGQSYLRKLLVDSTHKKKNGSVEKIAHYRDIPVLFRYSRESNCIMIPIKKSTKQALETVFTIVGVATVIFYIYFIAGGFLKFLIDVYRGQPFTLKNVNRLKLIALGLIIYPVLMFLLNLAMPLVFRRYFTGDIVLNNISWTDSWPIFTTGIVFLLLYKAFVNGKKLKEEQDLVI